MFTVKSERKTKVVQIPDKMNDQTAEENKVVADGFIFASNATEKRWEPFRVIYIKRT